MTSRRFVPLAFACAAAIALSASVHAKVENQIVANVSFEFYAGDTPLPAGSYRLSVLRNGGPAEVQLRNEKGDVVATLAPLTRLARQHVGDAPKGSLVFDHTGGRHSLSEAWFPGQDGFLLRVGAEEHDHAVLEVK